MDVISYALAKKHTNEKIAEQKLKVAKVEHELNDLKGVLQQVNINHEAKQKVSGYGIISLPKNAANGQVSGSVSGLTVVNLLGEHDTETEVLDANIYENIFLSTNGGIGKFGDERKKINFTIGHKYFVAITLKPESDKAIEKIRTYYDGAADSVSDVLGNLKFIEDVGVAIFTTTREANELCFVSTTEGGNYYHQSTVLIDLTSTFGEGNEPTEEECYRMFVDYFDNTKSTIGSMRIKSVGKNLFDSNKCLEGYVNTSTGHPITHTKGRGLTSAFIPVKAGIYTLTYKNMENSRNTLLGFDLTGNIIDGVPWSSELVRTLVMPMDGYVVLSIINDSAAHKTLYEYLNVYSPQLERGDTATQYEPYKESTAYIVAKDKDNKIVNLRSLPNGVKDEVSLNDKKLTKNISGDTTISDIAYASLDTTTYTNVDVVVTTAFSNAKAGTIAVDGMTRYYNKDGVELTEVAQTDIDLEASVGKYYWGEDKKLYIIVAKGDYTDIAAARTGLGTTKLNYQLAEPVEIPIEVSGNIVSYPSGTIYIERTVPDAGIYTDKMTVLHQDLPIKALEKLSKIDFMTGLETELDVSDAIIAEDKLSFTHPDLVDGDIVFFTYEYDRESTEGETEIEYYDSRYVIKDSVTDKFYKWHIAVADGVPSIELTEV